MVTRATQRSLTDDKKWAASARMVRAVNEMKRAIVTYGVMSPEVGDAIKEARLAEKEYKRIAK